MRRSGGNIPGGPFWRRTGGKVIIDATKPPLCAGKEARLPFERLKPMGWESVRLEDFLPEYSRTLQLDWEI